jgi:hypothetical protein
MAQASKSHSMIETGNREVRGFHSGILPVFATIILAVHLSSFWRLDILPYTDLSNHLAEAYLVKALSDPSNELNKYFVNEIKWFTPSSLHAVICSFPANVETANRIFYSLYPLILFFSMKRLTAHSSMSLMMASITFLLLYNYSMTLGFTGYTFGIALTLLTMVLLVQLIEKPGIFRMVLLAAAIVLLFYVHILTSLFACAGVVVSIVATGDMRIRQRISCLASLAPVLILIHVWIIHSSSFYDRNLTSGFLYSYYTSDFLDSLPYRFKVVFMHDNLHLATGAMDAVVSFLLTLPIVAGCILGVIGIHLKKITSINLPAKSIANVFIIVSSVCFFVLPARLPGQGVLLQRYSVFLLLGLIWRMSFIDWSRYRKFFVAVVVIFVTAHAALWFQFHSSFQKTAAPLRKLLCTTPGLEGKSLAAIIEDYNFRSLPTYAHFQNYHLIWNHGIVPTKIWEYRFRLIGLKHQGLLPSYQEWVEKDSRFGRLFRIYENMDFMLCKGLDAFERTCESGSYVPVSSENQWYLLRKSKN